MAGNPSIGKILGLKDLEITGQYIEEVFSKEFIEIFYKNYKNCIESGYKLSYESCINMPPGLVFIHTTLVPIHDDKGKIYRILGISTDITKYIEMTENLKRAKEEAEYANNAKSEYIVISVKDNGVGIPEDKHKTIFERYKQVDQLLTRKYEGSGIGLSLTKSFVEALGGKLSVNSKLGCGSEFVVELPCKITSRNGQQDDKEYTLNDYSIIQKISVELSDLYSI